MSHPEGAPVSFGRWFGLGLGARRLARHGFNQGPKHRVDRFWSDKNLGDVRVNHNNATVLLEARGKTVRLGFAVVKAVLGQEPAGIAAPLFLTVSVFSKISALLLRRQARADDANRVGTLGKADQ